MQPDELNKLFSGTEAGSSTEARKKAKQAAMEAFSEFHSDADSSAAKNNQGSDQGTPQSNRPTDVNDSKSRRNGMSILFQRWVYSGLASAAVLVLMVSLGVNVLTPELDNQAGFSNGKKADLAMPERKRALKPYARLEEVTVSAELAGSPQDVLTSAPMMADHASVQGFSLAKSRAMPETLPFQPPYEGRDRFENVEQNAVNLVSEQPVSTFSIDVDTASYSFVRKQLNQGVLPQKDAIRLEEMVNYFQYDYPKPATKEEPFAASVSVLDSPWVGGNKLIHIGIRGFDMPRESVPNSNLVFLLDVSGSMNSPDKLPLVKQSMNLLLTNLKPTDTVAIVVYAGAAGTVLEPTQVKNKQKIIDALKQLNAGGSTAGGEGIKAAYQLARNSFKEDAVNRVILATDGDFNVGITSREELKGFVERQRNEGIFLTVLGFGQGNYNDHLMQQLAQNGNGLAAYIDTLSEAQKVLVDEATSTLFPIASDVKIQMEFNPNTVSEYRLLGYETRALNREDFNNDKVDAGDIGAGHRVTAIYEITPVGSAGGLIEPTRYESANKKKGAYDKEYGFLKIRYKLPGEKISKLVTVPAEVSGSSANQNAVLAGEINFSLAVAGFADLLKGGKYSGDWDYQSIIELANKNKGEDLFGYRAEFVQLVRKAETAEGLRLLLGP